MDAMYETWVSRWQAALDACQRKGGEASELVILPPATSEAVAELETKIGQILPPSFRKVLLEFSSHVEVRWNLGVNNIEPPVELSGTSAGDCTWNLDNLALSEMWRKDAEEDSYDYPDGIFDEKWRNKLALYSQGNGDMLAFDLACEADSPVVCLSHEGDYVCPHHGYRLGNNFIDFMERWTSLLAFHGRIVG